MKIYIIDELNPLLEINNFNLEQISNSGQVFRIKNMTENVFIVWYGQYSVLIQKINNNYYFHCSKDEFYSIWFHYFDFNNNIYEKIEQYIKINDKFLSNSYNYGKNIRILNQDLFEVIISFILSQRRNISSIRTSIEKFCKAFGQKQKYGYTFPCIDDLKNVSLNELSDLGFGYRDKYVYNFIKIVKNNPNYLKNLKLNKYPKNELLNLYGIGDKVASCILLFGLHDFNSLPKDVWINRVLDKYYNNNFPYDEYQGLLQQYIFHYIIQNKHLIDNI